MPRGGKRTSTKVKECVCKNCGALSNFTGVGSSPQYCSSRCKEEYHLKKSGFSLVCQECGSEFRSLRSDARFCSKKCNGNAMRTETHYRTKYTKHCTVCGEEFETINQNQICCSQTCASKYRGEKAKKHYTCEYCGEEFYRPNGFRMRYCSRQCFYNARFGTAEERAGRDVLRQVMQTNDKLEKMMHKVCLECNAAFDTMYPKQIYCSDECCYRANLRQHREQWAEQYEPRLFTCKECGTKITTECGDTRRAFCSQACMNSYFSKSYNKKRSRQLKKAFIKNVLFDALYDRDNGICQICGLPVAYDKSPEKMWSATIDHIIPLSVGGKHEPDNCQLAHRLCNSLKLQAADTYMIDWNEMLKADKERWEEALDEYENYMELTYPRGGHISTAV